MNKVLGIDLGTTYSCVSYIDASGKPVVQKNSEGELTTPSVVLFESPNNVVVGTPAKESSKLYPEDVVSFVKRSIGQPGAAWYIQGADRSPEEVSSYILKKVVGDAVTALQGEGKLGPGELITDVVITCPAYFGIAEREATRKAGELAGLNVLNIINEPTAAAITYGVSDLSDNKVVLVYDLGGGTFDITMIDISSNAVKVICTGGDHSLGGKLWDDRIIEYVAGEFARQTRSTVDILSDMETFQELSLSVERAKKMLSARDKAPIAVNFGGDRARVELTREKFDALTGDLLERTILLTQEMLEEAAKKGYDKSAFAEILMVGGSTRMPQVKARIQKEFSVPVKIFDPDESVAKGAAIFANRQAFFSEVIEKTAAETGKSESQVRREIQSGKAKVKELAQKVEMETEDAGDTADIDIINVTSRSFGTIAFRSLKESAPAEVENEEESAEPAEVLYNMILKNAELPAAQVKKFFTVADEQRTVTIRVLESLSSEEIAAPDEGTEIGEAILELPEGLPAGSPIEIEFILGDGGLLELEAKENTGGRTVSARFETADAISESEFKMAKQRIEDAAVF
ncbi:MAG: Hsp70 family protein [Oscillospiraceae bacterium]|nr:Hsp70 family protein [Oscillospiraceae bacterium]